jgi:kynurenine formamidase
MKGLSLRPPRPGAPKLSNWGVFGDEDEVGTLNYQTPDVVQRGAAEVRLGHHYPLNLPIDLPTDRAILRPEVEKTAHLHNVEFDGIVCNDDHVLLATQGSSQWDSFVHTGCHEPGVDGVFYNGFGREDIDETGYAQRGGIDKVAQRGIASRGVLLDVARMLAGGSSDPLPIDHAIDPAQFHDCIRHQGVEIQPGDVVCFRTGWTELYLDADRERRRELMTPAPNEAAPVNPGITTDLAPIAHEQRWSAVTADNLAIEVAPFRPDNLQSAHITMQRNLGLPFGEILCFRELAAASAEDRRWTFFFVAVPLWIPGGMGSPANAMAIR